VKPEARLLRDSESFVMGAIVAAGLAAGLALGPWSVAHVMRGAWRSGFRGSSPALRRSRSPRLPAGALMRRMSRSAHLPGVWVGMLLRCGLRNGCFQRFQ